ncbi:hypothetical protein WN48_04079 [Eufriesea mexicana]|uniref:Uncharacterized protein n=1 Tax=Eufriesea mexicana TaxID=516756 RepID=A0A310SAF8_9HYME|nr:hypothetical protein WN48_04079 [Eufriesea mexicana]
MSVHVRKSHCQPTTTTSFIIQMYNQIKCFDCLLGNVEIYVDYAINHGEKAHVSEKNLTIHTH